MAIKSLITYFVGFGIFMIEASLVIQRQFFSCTHVHGVHEMNGDNEYTIRMTY